MDIVERIRIYEIDHAPEGWPAIKMKEVSELADEIERLRAELDQLMSQQSPAVAVPDSDYIPGVLETAVELYTHRWSDEFCDVNIGIMKKGMGFIYPEGLIEFARQIKYREFELLPNISLSPRITEQDDPIALTNEQIEVLGRPNFACSSIARILVNKGFYAEIPQRSENEQAVAIHFMSRMLEKYGSNWKI